jgi:hypothetical protein
MVGEWERGLKLMEKAMRLNPHHPGWYQFVPFMKYYRQGEYYTKLEKVHQMRNRVLQR